MKDDTLQHCPLHTLPHAGGSNRRGAATRTPCTPHYSRSSASTYTPYPSDTRADPTSQTARYPFVVPTLLDAFIAVTRIQGRGGAAGPGGPAGGGGGLSGGSGMGGPSPMGGMSGPSPMSGMGGSSGSPMGGMGGGMSGMGGSMSGLSGGMSGMSGGMGGMGGMSGSMSGPSGSVKEEER